MKNHIIAARLDGIRKLAAALQIIPEDCGNMAAICAAEPGAGWAREEAGGHPLAWTT